METSVTTLIRDFLYEHKILTRELASRIGISTRNLDYTLQKNDMTISLLHRISKALQHNFFTAFDPLDEKTESDTTGSDPANDLTTLKHRVALLEQENAYLKQINQLLATSNPLSKKP